MKERVFLDTNILLDLIQERPGYMEAARILQRHEDGEFDICMSTLSIANIAYVLRKTVARSLLIPTLKQISSVIKVVSMDDAQLQQAYCLDGPDFEDLMQLACAVAHGCSVIVTHNPRDFRIRKGLLEDFVMPTILSPEEFENRAW